MLIKGLQKTTLVDYPGRIASTLFLYGCNFLCPFCFSSSLVLPEGKDTPNLAESEVLALLEKRKKYIEAVCVTGGEPTLNQDLPAFLSKLKAIGLLVKLDTNGSNPGMLGEIISSRRVDYIAMDIKAPLEKYELATRVVIDTEKIQKSIELIRQAGVDYEFRTTVVSSLHKKEDILSICQWLAGSKRYCLQQFQPQKTLDKAFSAVKPYTPRQMNKFAALAKPFFGECEVKNI